MKQLNFLGEIRQSRIVSRFTSLTRSGYQQTYHRYSQKELLQRGNNIEKLMVKKSAEAVGTMKCCEVLLWMTVANKFVPLPPW